MSLDAMPAAYRRSQSTLTEEEIVEGIAGYQRLIAKETKVKNAAEAYLSAYKAPKSREEKDAREEAENNLKQAKEKINYYNMEILRLKAPERQSVLFTDRLQLLHELQRRYMIEVNVKKGIEQMLETVKASMGPVTDKRSQKQISASLEPILKKLNEAQQREQILSNAISKHNANPEHLNVAQYEKERTAWAALTGVLYLKVDSVENVADGRLSDKGAAALTNHRSKDSKIERDHMVVEIRCDNQLLGSTKPQKALLNRGHLTSKFNESFEFNIKKSKELEILIYVDGVVLCGLIFVRLQNLIDSLRRGLTVNVEPEGSCRLELGFENPEITEAVVPEIRRQGHVMKQKVTIVSEHRLIPTAFYQVKQCHVCKELLSGSGRQGLKCEVCNQTVHYRCLHNLVDKCEGLAGLARRAKENSLAVAATQQVSSAAGDPPQIGGMRHSIPHSWVTHMSLKPAFCCHCGAFVVGIRGKGRRCQHCNLTCHKNCERYVKDYCGMTLEMMLALSQTEPVETGDDDATSLEEQISRQTSLMDLNREKAEQMLNSGGDIEAQERAAAIAVSVASASEVTAVEVPVPVIPTATEAMEGKVQRAKSLEKIVAKDAEEKKKDVSIDQFTFVSVLGKGNFGKVILSEHNNSTSLYAIKVLKKTFIIEQDEIEGIETEKGVFAAIGGYHPFLLQLYACLQTPTHLCFVMEYANGGDLMLHIHQEIFGEDRGKFYSAEILCGLGYLHSKGIIYRDLKLDNLLLDRHGHIKIADYGLCKLNMLNEDGTDRTTGTFCGTPEFIAPEILQEDQYTRVVDWWSFGVLVYEMILGQSPFPGEDDVEIFENIMRNRVHYPRWLSPEASSLIQSLLVKDPTKRLGASRQDADEIKQHIFFADMNFDDVENLRIKPAFVPKLNDDRDVRYFEDEFTSEPPIMTPGRQKLSATEQSLFEGFSFVAPGAFE
eukprot:Clim_evm42s77 gene=Clim_evmTU42s77